MTRTVPYGTPAPMNELTKISAAENSGSDTPSKREQEVLAAVLDLMVEEGDGFSMASVAKKASCSKETLYRWFGDRDGLLTATVKWQASKVILPSFQERDLTLEDYVIALREFASSWLTVLTGDVSIALNRLAVSHAGNGKSSLGRIVLENGPFAIKTRLIPVFQLGNEAGFINCDPEEAFRDFFGLVVADTQIRALLGEAHRPSEPEIQKFAQRAVEKFLTQCGNPNQEQRTHN